MSKASVRCVGTIPPHKPGEVVEIDVDENGTPLEWPWRRRLSHGDAVLETQPKRPRAKPEKE